jgi:NADPH:quinone reductase-like Zn-dependent oxidoreductase
MTPPDAPTSGRSLRSTITSDGRVRLSLEERPLPELKEGQVLVAVEASPINPSDLGILLGPMRPDALTREGDDLVGSVPAELLQWARDRLDKPLPVGNEGAGTVVAGVPEMVGKRVALFGGSMWADFRVADAARWSSCPTRSARSRARRSSSTR